MQLASQQPAAPSHCMSANSRCHRPHANLRSAATSAVARAAAHTSCSSAPSATSAAAAQPQPHSPLVARAHAEPAPIYTTRPHSHMHPAAAHVQRQRSQLRSEQQRASGQQQHRTVRRRKRRKVRIPAQVRDAHIDSIMAQLQKGATLPILPPRARDIAAHAGVPSGESWLQSPFMDSDAAFQRHKEVCAPEGMRATLFECQCSCKSLFAASPHLGCRHTLNGCHAALALEHSCALNFDVLITSQHRQWHHHKSATQASAHLIMPCAGPHTASVPCNQRPRVPRPPAP